MTYKIIRNFLNRKPRVIMRGLTLEEAQAYCSDPETSGYTAKSARARAITRRYGLWFDGYDVE